MPRWLAAIVVAAAASTAAGHAAEALPPPAQLAADFGHAVHAIDHGYAYFERGGRAAWRRSAAALEARAMRARSRSEFVGALEAMLRPLHDDHVSLSERGNASPRRVPAETDIWAHWEEGAAQVDAVRTYGDADAAGLKPGQSVVSIDDAPVEKAVAERLRGERAPSVEARDWALRQALAGPDKGVLRLQVAEGAAVRTLAIERNAAPRANGALLLARRIGEQRDLGYLRPRQGLRDPRLVEQFERALESFRGTRGLIIDLREASDGSREITRGLLSLFATEEKAWQVLEDRNGARSIDRVAPRGGNPYGRPIVVLVDRWTAGEGEALAAGLSAVARARLIGTPMAGLRGELAQVRLPHTGLTLRFPAQKTYHVNGTPRERIVPDVAVNLAAPSGGPGDPILYQGLKVMEK